MLHHARKRTRDAYPFHIALSRPYLKHGANILDNSGDFQKSIKSFPFVPALQYPFSKHSGSTVKYSQDKWIQLC
jgi:hypothetical protein